MLSSKCPFLWYKCPKCKKCRWSKSNCWFGPLYCTTDRELDRVINDGKSGIYEYVLTREEKYLSIRAFTDNMKREAYERQAGVCAVCGDHFEFSEMEADHVTPWVEGGQTSAENCQMLCREDNRRKGRR